MKRWVAGFDRTCVRWYLEAMARVLLSRERGAGRGRRPIGRRGRAAPAAGAATAAVLARARHGDGSAGA